MVKEYLNHNNYERELALGIVDALEFWSTSRYKRFLQRGRPGALDQDWFKWFIGEWSVARTVGTDNQEKVRRYLDTIFRKEMEERKGAAAIDKAAKYIQKNNWTSRIRKDGKSTLPLSLVSKVGFFFCPDIIVPYDSFSRRGLNVLRRPKKEGGEGHLQYETYTQYLNVFDSKFRMAKQLIASEVKERWVIELARRLGCDSKWLNKKRFYRKIFDNQLMRIAGRSRD